jgi:hypothetical protein
MKYTLWQTKYRGKLIKPGKTDFLVTFELAGCNVIVELGPDGLHVLTMQCLTILRKLAEENKETSAEGLLRGPARKLKTFSDRSIQVVLHEVPPQFLIPFLWYMKDAELLALFLKNCGSWSARSLMDELKTFYPGLDPDNAPSYIVHKGRTALEEIVRAIADLHRSGEISESL